MVESLIYYIIKIKTKKLSRTIELGTRIGVEIGENEEEAVGAGVSMGVGGILVIMSPLYLYRY